MILEKASTFSKERIVIHAESKKETKKWQITLLVILGVLLLLFLFLLWFYYAKLSLMQYDTSSGVSIDTEVSVDDDDHNIETSGVSNDRYSGG